MVLRDSTALYKMIEAQVKEGEIDKYEKWTEDKISSFSLYDS